MKRRLTRAPEAAIYERLLAERDTRVAELTEALKHQDERVRDLTASLKHEQARHKGGMGSDMRAGTVGFLIALPLGSVWHLLQDFYRTHTATAAVMTFLALYFGVTMYAAYRMIRTAWIARRAAARISRTAAYGVQLLYSIVVTFAMLMATIFGGHDHQGNWPQCILPIGGAASLYNYFQMRRCAERSGGPVPGTAQVRSWVDLK